MHNADIRKIENVPERNPMANRNCVFDSICGLNDALYTVPLYTAYPVQKLPISAGFPFTVGAQGTVSVSTLLEVINVMDAFKMSSLSIEKLDTVAVGTPSGALVL